VDGFRPIFCVAVDVSSGAVKSGFTERFANAVSGVLSKMADTQTVVLVAYDGLVMVGDSEHRRWIAVSDAEEMVLPSFRAGTLGESREWLQRALAGLGSRLPNSDANCAKMLKVVRFLLRENGGVLVAGIHGGRVEVADAQEIALGFNSDWISAHLVVDEPLGLEAMAAVPGLTSGSCVIASSEGEISQELGRILGDRYAWRAIGKLRVSAGVRVVGHLASAVMRNGNVSMFASFPGGSAVAYELDTTEKKADWVFLQFAFMFVADDGSQITRVFTFSCETHEDFYARIDGEAMNAFVLKQAATVAINEGIECGRGVIEKSPFAPALRGAPLFTAGNSDVAVQQMITLRTARIEDITAYIRAG
jgi:hypothetical protein